MSTADRNRQELPSGFVVSLGDALKFTIRGVGTVTPRGEQPPDPATAPQTPQPTPEPPPDYHRV